MTLENAILDAIDAHGPLYRAALEKHVGASGEKLRTALRRMCRQGLLVEEPQRVKINHGMFMVMVYRHSDGSFRASMDEWPSPVNSVFDYAARFNDHAEQ